MSKKHDRLARQTIRDLLAGNPPASNEPSLDHGPWAETIAILLEAHAEGGPAGVRQAWQILAKADRALVRLISSGRPPPLEGATAHVRKLLELEPEVLIDHIDQARQLSDLAPFVKQAMTIRKLLARNRKEAVAYVIRRLLVGSKRLLLDVGEDLRGRPYLVADDRAIWPLTGELAPVRVMLAESGLNVSEPAFTWLLADLEKAAYSEGQRICLAHFTTRRGQALYVSAGPGRLVKAEVEQGRAALTAMENGADQVYFAGETSLPEWDPAPQSRSPFDLAAFNPALVTPPNLPAYTVEVQRLLLEAWLIAVIADIRPVPLLAAVGQMDGGKTTLIKAVCQLLIDSPPTSLSDDPRDLWSLAVGLPVLGLDNVDRESPPWLADLFAALCSGIGFDRRRLFTNAVIDRRRARAVPLLSTRNGGCLARPDVSQRTLLLLTGQFTGRRRSDKQMFEEIDRNRAAVLTWLVEKAVLALARLPQAPLDLPSRFVDFAGLVWALKADLAQPALTALQQAQALLVGEEDRLLAALIEYADELLGPLNHWQGRATELVDRLQHLGAVLPYLGGGKAIAFRLREGQSILAMFGLSLAWEQKSNTTYFTLRRRPEKVV